MSTAQAPQAPQTGKTEATVPAIGSFITSGDVDKMNPAALAAAIKDGRKLSISGRRLAEVRGMLPN